MDNTDLCLTAASVVPVVMLSSLSGLVATASPITVKAEFSRPVRFENTHVTVQGGTASVTDTVTLVPSTTFTVSFDVNTVNELVVRVPNGVLFDATNATNPYDAELRVTGVVAPYDPCAHDPDVPAFSVCLPCPAGQYANNQCACVGEWHPEPRSLCVTPCW